MKLFEKLIWKLAGKGQSAPFHTDDQVGGYVKYDQHPGKLYIIGDVHGCLDLLRELETAIVEDCGDVPGAEIILLGDTIDRGPQSAAVLDHLMTPPPSGFKRRVIAGNHELMMLRFLHAPKRNAAWLDFGGLETLASYGVSVSAVEEIKSSNSKAKQVLSSYIPEEHVTWLHQLPLLIEYPRCYLVHAGLRPKVQIADQSTEDMTGIRSGFLDSDYDFGKWVIHGHTPVKKPEVHDNRINIDTGAYATGCLTCVCMTETGSPTFLSTSPPL